MRTAKPVTTLTRKSKTRAQANTRTACTRNPALPHPVRNAPWAAISACHATCPGWNCLGRTSNSRITAFVLRTQANLILIRGKPGSVRRLRPESSFQFVKATIQFKSNLVVPILLDSFAGILQSSSGKFLMPRSVG